MEVNNILTRCWSENHQERMNMEYIELTLKKRMPYLRNGDTTGLNQSIRKVTGINEL